jgi:GNAT superfamily N-acetyltransferase
MAERANIVDKYGEGYSIELFESDPFFAMRVYRGDVQVGYARCLVENDQVELTDIKIAGRLKRHTLFTVLLGPLRSFMAKNYQSRGIGSKLLKEVIAYSREIGAASIHGHLEGKTELLTKWFSHHGFEVENSTGKISLKLGPGEIQKGHVVLTVSV